MLQQLGDKPLLGMDLKDLQTWIGPDEPAYRARQLYDAVYRNQVADLWKSSNLPKTLRDRLGPGCLGLPELEHRYQSSDGTIRYLLRLQDNRSVEAVLMPNDRMGGSGTAQPLGNRHRADAETSSADAPTVEARHTICISSQVGCPVDCKFCLTALMGLERNLTAGEIVGQVMYVAQENQLNTATDLNIVMMGMGEPLLNLENVLKATQLLTDPSGLAMSPKRLTLSTSGIVPKMAELGKAEARPKLAVSLNASTQAQRQQLMPITQKYSLNDLMQACREYPLRTWEKLTFEYVLLRGVNDSDADARRVVRLLAHLNCKVNLIALNPGPGINFETPAPERVASFQEIIRKALPCFIRRPRGLDIYAACGQLKRVTSNLVAIGH